MDSAEQVSARRHARIWDGPQGTEVPGGMASICLRNRPPKAGDAPAAKDLFSIAQCTIPRAPDEGKTG
jgi:hypothetical protein